MSLTPNEIYDLAQWRTQQFNTDRTRWNMASNIYRGQHRTMFPREFREGEIAKVAGFVKHSWDMFARLVAKVPDIRVTPLKLTKTERDRAEKIEKILFSYNNMWNMRRRMKVMAHYQVGYGAVAVGVVPNEQAKTPMFLVEDPRNALPGPGWDATSVSSPSFDSSQLQNGMSNGDVGSGLSDIIIRKSMTGRQLRTMFPNNEELKRLIPDSAKGLNESFSVFQYYDDTNYTTVMQNGIELAPPTPHGAQKCPWMFVTSFTPDQPAGSGMFEQQVGLEVAFMRILDQKLALNDAVTWPWMKYKGFVEFDPAKREIRLGSPDADAEFLTPPPTFQVDRDLSQIRDLVRTLNFESEASQGSVQGGPITGRGLTELSKATTEVVQDYFDDNSHLLPFIYTTALMMDSKLWPSEKKMLSGRGHGETFLEEYTPGKAIGERFGQVSVEFGPGLGGFDGHLQMLQDLGADSISKDTIMSKNPNIPSVSEEKKKIRLEKIEDLIFSEALQGQAAVPLPWLAQLAQVIEEGGDERQWLINNPPGQATATPQNTAPTPPGAAGGPLDENAPPEEGEQGFAPPSGFNNAPRMTASGAPPGGGGKMAAPSLAALLGGG